MPSYEFRITIKGETRNIQGVNAIKEMVQRQTNEVLANTRLLYQGSDSPPKVNLSMSVAHTSFSNIPFIETVSETLTEEPDKENPFATMD